MTLSSVRLTGVVRRHLGTIHGLGHFVLRHRGGVGRTLHKQTEKAAYQGKRFKK